MGGGSTSTSSSSRPLTAGERTEAFNAGISNISGGLPGAFNSTTTQSIGQPYISVPVTDSEGMVMRYEQQPNPAYVPGRTTSTLDAPEYVAPTYNQTNIERMNGGDYDKLEQNLIESRTAPLNYALQKAQSGVDENAAKRGVWSSGLAIQSQNDLADKFAPQLRAAAADASAARYGMQQADINSANQLNQTNAAQKNSFEMENANRKYNQSWTGLNYLKDLYNGTGGTISSGSGGGWNFSI